MTRVEFESWIRKHYGELVAVARRRVQQDPEDVVQDAVAGMLKSPALARVQASDAPGVLGVWPWAVGFVRGHAAVDRRSAERAEKSLQAAGSSLGVGQNEFEGRYAGRVGFGEYPLFRDGRCTGVHQQWLQGVKVARPGCGAYRTARVEAGYDKLPTSGRRASYVYTVLACPNGGREYFSGELRGLERVAPPAVDTYDWIDLNRDAKTSRRPRTGISAADLLPLRPVRGPLVCGPCREGKPYLLSCIHTFAPRVRKEMAA